MNQLPRQLFACSLPERVYANMPRIEPKLDNTQRGFRRGRSTTDEMFTAQNIFEKSWEHGRRKGGQAPLEFGNFRKKRLFS